MFTLTYTIHKTILPQKICHVSLPKYKLRLRPWISRPKVQKQKPKHVAYFEDCQPQGPQTSAGKGAIPVILRVLCTEYMTGLLICKRVT